MQQNELNDPLPAPVISTAQELLNDTFFENVRNEELKEINSLKQEDLKLRKQIEDEKRDFRKDAKDYLQICYSVLFLFFLLLFSLKVLGYNIIPDIVLLPILTFLLVNTTGFMTAVLLYYFRK